MICTLLERTEKGENTSDIQRVLREKAREKMKPEQEDDKLYTGKHCKHSNCSIIYIIVCPSYALNITKHFTFRTYILINTMSQAFMLISSIL
jgi:hypothetical protein